MVLGCLINCSTLVDKFVMNEMQSRGRAFKHSWCVLSCRLIKSHLTLYDPKECLLPGSSVRGLLQARILEWAAISSSRGSSWCRDRTCISRGSRIAGGSFTDDSVMNEM